MIITRVGLLSLALVLSLFSTAWAGYRHGKAGGVSAPVLSAATASTDGNDHAFIGVTTDTGSGTLFYDGSTNCAANPTAAQIKTGTTPGHVVNGSQSVSSSGVQSANPGSLSAVTAYCFYFVQTTSLDSNIVNSSSFTTNGTLSFNTSTTAAWNSNPNAAAFNTVVAAVHAEFTACFAPPTNITISQQYDFQSTPGALGTTFAEPSNDLYSNPIRGFLIALPGKNSIQTAIYASPPVSDPTGLGDNYYITNAQSLAIGSARFSGQPDWSTTIDSGTSWDTTTNCSGGGVCLRGVLTHEDAEGMGRKSGIDSGGNAGLMEFSSYSGAGVRNVTTTGARFPSVDGGTTNLISPFQYNQGGGDKGDWTASGTDDFTAIGSAFTPTMSTLDVKEMSKEGWILTHSCRAVAP